MSMQNEQKNQSVEPRLTEIKDCLYRVAIKAIIINGDKVLLVKDSRDKDWSLPGGGVDYGEDAVTALKRELTEEIGVSAEDVQSDGKVIGIIIGHIKGGIPRCNIHYKVTLITEKVATTDETSDLKWTPVSELENLDYDNAAGDKSEIITLINQAQTALS